VEGIAMTPVERSVERSVGSDIVCDRRTFAEIEDRPVVRERVERIREHIPVEKTFETIVRPVGERVLETNRQLETLDVKVVEVDRARQITDYPTSIDLTGLNREVLADGTIIYRQIFTEIEDRPVVRERIERFVEHIPVEKTFEKIVRPAGERVLADRATTEVIDVNEVEVDRARGSRCPTTTAL
jgi:hypothetical protein